MSNVGSFPELLRHAAEQGASDIHVCAGVPVRIRVSGRLLPVGEPLKADDSLAIASHILQAAGRPLPKTPQEFIYQLREEDCAYSVEGVGRYRVNICKQRGSAMIVLRLIADSVPSMEELGLPPVMNEIATEERGLILVTGATGSGKSTTLSAMIDHIVARRECKIITIEDPIEFIYHDGKASVSQREVGGDTDSFANAMRAALRQDPDVILVGEMRDADTVEIGLKAAETGHLVMSTLHTPDAPKTINRLASFFDSNEEKLLRIRLADCLKAIISQRLLP